MRNYSTPIGKKERKESRDMTIGRLIGIAKTTKNFRLLSLINKLNTDIDTLQNETNELRNELIDTRYKLIYKK